MINKSDSRCAVVRFCYHSYDYRLNWTPLSPITITYRTFLLPTQLLSWCFLLEHFAQFHPVARILIRVLTRKKLKIWDFFHFKIKSPNVKRSLQSCKVSKSSSTKFAPTLALKWYPQDLIGRAKLFDISAASQHQGSSGRQMYLHPAHFPFGPQKGAFYRGQFVIWPRVLIIIKHLS